MMLKEVLDRTVQFFKDKKFDSPRLDAELLMSRALGLRRLDLYLKFDQPIGEKELGDCRELVRRRAQGEPVAYILGEKDFFGATFRVDKRVLIPRPETELLAEAATSFIKDHAIEAPAILDLGCGSGCLGLSLALKFPQARVTLVDASSEALSVARENAEMLGVLDRCEFQLGRVQDVSFEEASFDVVLANPPYIDRQDPRVQPTVHQFEPHSALYSSDAGFADFREWAPRAFAALKPGAFMGFEFGAGQEELAKKLFSELGLERVRLIRDYSDFDRHAVGVKGDA